MPAADTRTAAHFLEQASFGPSPADVALVESIGPAAWLDQQFQLPETPIANGLDGNGVRNALFLNMANAPDQLRQRMMFALSQIIVVSASKTGSGEELTPWVRLLSLRAFGNYRDLLRDVTVSPTMGKYLDLVFSRRATATSSPNENYARELMQLFSIGVWDLNQDGTLKRDAAGLPIPSYTQDTIKEVARALTGWTYPTQPGRTDSNSNPEYFVGELLPRITTHDIGAKTLLSGLVLQAVPTATQAATIADMEAVVDNIFHHPNVPPFVASRLIRSLVTSNPSPAYIHRVANAFSDNGAGVRGDLKAVLRAVLMDPEAATFSSEDGRLKDHVMHVLGMGRALGATIANPDGFNYVFSNLTQRVLTPATVFNFYSLLGALPGHADLLGPEFGIYPPALAIQRANFIYSLLNGSFSSSFALDLTPYTNVAADSAGLVELVNQRLMFGRMTPELRELLVVATNVVPASSPRDRALGVLYLAAISSEYSVYSDNTATGAPAVQPPTGLAVTSMAGNMVTLQWKAPLIGPAATSYVLEGGTVPGQVIASMPTGSADPKLTFVAPPGSYYVRIHTISNGARSRASSEIRIYVDVPSGPTAPTNLLGVVNGSTVGLSWRNTFGGGAPTNVMLDVTGGLTTSMAIGLSESFTFAGVPPGTYTFSVRGINSGGTSGSSNSVTLTFPSACNGSTPSTPSNFVAARAGNVLTVSWLPSTSGRASTSYQVNVTGSFSTTVTTTARSVSSPVGPGTYNIRVRAVNACGNSSYTAFQTLTVP